MSLVVVTSLGAMELLQDESGSYLVATGDDIGAPRALAAEIEHDPSSYTAWVTQPPPPTTASTVPSYPAGSVVHQGALSTIDDPGKCFQADAPGVVGSTIDREPCDGGDDQSVAASGETSAAVAFEFLDAANSGLCLLAEALTDRIVMATCDGSDQQLFDVTDNGGSYTFVNRSSGMCLYENGSGLRHRACTGNDDQRFTF